MSMDSIRSNNVLKLVRKLNTITNHIKQRKNQIKLQHRYFPQESLLLKTHLSSIVYSPWNHETITMHSSHKSFLHSQLSHTDPKKIDEHLANFQLLLNLPCLRNKCGMQSLFFRNSSLPKMCNAHGKSYGCITASGQFAKNTTDS